MSDQPRIAAFGIAAAPTERAQTRRRPLRDLLVGQAVSSLGDWMGTVALMALVLEITGSATAVGGVLVLRPPPWWPVRSPPG